ncbi:MAG: trypsin-like peptidase domain-containing protein [Proteobacteria bacterium]|nr:trypsin-like peptidase domain-containing protein [Pseudomonadota bacterium]
MFYLMNINLIPGALFAGLISTLLPLPPAQAFDASVMQSVVKVLPDWPAADRGQSAAGRPRDPEGSGVVVLDGGYIATNVHVIGNAKTVEIVLADGRRMAAAIVGRDIATDVALLKAPVALPAVTMGPPPALGAPVCAVGNPFGLGLSVSCGVVSATGRAGIGFNEIEDFIQTDASVNPGGSGGGLFDAAGKFVGLVSAIFTKRSDANVGVNFAASAALVQRVARDLRDFGRVNLGDAGIDVGPLPPALAKTVGGLLVTAVRPDGPAFAVGIDAGDIVTMVNGNPVLAAQGFRAELLKTMPGREVTVATVRGGKSLSSTYKLAPRP